MRDKISEVFYLKMSNIFWGIFSNIFRIPMERLGSFHDNSRVSNIESDNSQNVGLEDYNNISVGFFPHYTTPSIIRCGRVMADNIAYAKFRKSLLI